MASSSVEYNFFGNSGLQVSNLCLGAGTFGSMKESDGPMGVMFSNPKQADEATSHKILDRYVELGGNFIDTADVYSAGQSEQIVGNWMKKKNRDQIIISTKVRNPLTSADMMNPNKSGLSRRHMVKACEDSLSRLQMDYLDIYIAHLWDDGTPIEETLRTFDDLIRCGKIRYFAYSNVCGWQLQKIVETTKHLGLNPCVGLQQQYSLVCRHPEYEELKVCENEGIGVMPWSPLCGGMLTGKFKRNVVPDQKGSRAGYLDAMKKQGKFFFSYYEDVADQESFWTLMDLIEKIAKKHGKSVPQVALRWLLQHKFVSSVAIGATSVQQLEDNMGAGTGWQLSEEEMKELTEASPKSSMYPYSIVYGMSQAGRNNPFKK